LAEGSEEVIDEDLGLAFFVAGMPWEGIKSKIKSKSKMGGGGSGNAVIRDVRGREVPGTG
jgi:hypothetical protein